MMKIPASYHQNLQNLLPGLMEGTSQENKSDIE